MENVLTQLIKLLTGGLTEIAQNIGQGVNSLVTQMFVTTGENGVQGLSTFGGIIAIFGGVSLAIGLSRLLFNMLTSWGN